MIQPVHQRGQSFDYVEESPDEFFQLFPHRFDYIWAKHPSPGDKAQWLTESRHPLSDRLIQRGDCLYGVRFGAETGYCMLDIDVGSTYHPANDPFAVSRIMNLLEPAGFVTGVACSSSYSGGIHLYLPFEEKQSSWEVAAVVTALMEQGGFKVSSGQLEVFPNARSFPSGSTPSLFSAHRLPMQTGSYLLNASFEPIWSSRREFVQQWNHARSRNCVSRKTLQDLLKQVRRGKLPLTSKAEKFLHDLSTEIESGWTGHGQTNRLLGRIVMRTYIFHHILYGGAPLKGAALVEQVVKTAIALPGYKEFCQHQHEIEHRVQEWTACIESSKYFHYGQKKDKQEGVAESQIAPSVPEEPSWNQTQLSSARERIRSAIADLLEQCALPSGATARFKTLLQYGIGGSTLYRHRDLWHPVYLPGDNPPHPPLNQSVEWEGHQNSCPSHSTATSLFPSKGSNLLPAKVSSDCEPNDTTTLGSNAHGLSPDRQVGVEFVLEVLAEIKASHAATREAIKEAWEKADQLREEADNSTIVTRMKAYYASGDPILIAEAIAWAQINPQIRLEIEPPED